MLRDMFRILLMVIICVSTCAAFPAHAIDCSTWLSSPTLFEKRISSAGSEVTGWNIAGTYAPMRSQIFDAVDNRIWASCDEQFAFNHTALNRRTWTTGGVTLQCAAYGTPPLAYTDVGQVAFVNNSSYNYGPIIVHTLGMPFVDQPPTANQVISRTFDQSNATGMCTFSVVNTWTLPNPIVTGGSNMTYTSDGLYNDPVTVGPTFVPFRSFGNIIALGHSINTCTGVCQIPNPRFKTYLQRTKIENTFTNTNYADDVTFNSMFLTDRDAVPFGQSSPVSERAHTLTVLTDASQAGLPITGAGYLIAGQAEFKSSQIGGRNGMSLMVMRVADSGSLKVVNGGLLAWPAINSLLSTDGDTGVFDAINVTKILRKGTAGGFYVVGTVANSAAATPLLRAPRGFIVAFNSNGTFDTTFGSNGLVLVDNMLTTDRALIADAVVLTNGKPVVVMQDPAGLLTGSVRTQRFLTTGAVDTTWGSNGVRLFPITGCTNPAIDNLLVVTNGFNELFIGGSGHHN